MLTDAGRAPLHWLSDSKAPVEEAHATFRLVVPAPHPVEDTQGDQGPVACGGGTGTTVQKGAVGNTWRMKVCGDHGGRKMHWVGMVVTGKMWRCVGTMAGRKQH